MNATAAVNIGRVLICDDEPESKPVKTVVEKLKAYFDVDIAQTIADVQYYVDRLSDAVYNWVVLDLKGKNDQNDWEFVTALDYFEGNEKSRLLCLSNFIADCPGELFEKVEARCEKIYTKDDTNLLIKHILEDARVTSIKSRINDNSESLVEQAKDNRQMEENKSISLKLPKITYFTVLAFLLGLIGIAFQAATYRQEIISAIDNDKGARQEIASNLKSIVDMHESNMSARERAFLAEIKYQRAEIGQTAKDIKSIASEIKNAVERQNEILVQHGKFIENLMIDNKEAKDQRQRIIEKINSKHQ